MSDLTTNDMHTQSHSDGYWYATPSDHVSGSNQYEETGNSVAPTFGADPNLDVTSSVSDASDSITDTALEIAAAAVAIIGAFFGCGS